MQTKRGGPDVPLAERGDCFDACLASVLELPIEQVPCPHVDAWWDAAQHAVANHGYRLVYVVSTPTPAVEVADWLGPVYWLAGVPSLNLGLYEDGRPVLHVIVMRGDEVVHDPSLGDTYPLGKVGDNFMVQDAIVLLELEPKALAA